MENREFLLFTIRRLFPYGLLAFSSFFIWTYFLWQFVTGFRKGYNAKLTAGFFIGFWVLSALGNLWSSRTKYWIVALAFLIPIVIFPIWYRKLRDRTLTSRNTEPSVHLDDHESR